MILRPFWVSGYCSAPVKLPAFVLLLLASVQVSAAQRPLHIVLSLGDDLGMGDIHAYDPRSTIPTPEIDRMAAEGRRFYDVHSPAAVCTPTRYGVLTGKYPFRSRLDRSVLFSAYDMAVLKDEPETIATLLTRAGYATAAFGKWHLGVEAATRSGGGIARPGVDSSIYTTRDIDFAKPLRQGPRDHGFDRFFGLASSINHDPYSFVDDDRVAVAPTRFRPEFAHSPQSRIFREGWVADDWDDPQVCPRILERATAHIRESLTRKPQQPLLVYYASPAPHFPWVPPERSFGRTVKGAGGTDDSAAAHNDMVVHNDVEVGELRRALEDPNGDGRMDDSVLDDTLFIITSDNGSTVGYFPPYRDHKASIYEGGHRVPFIVRWPTQIQAGTRSDAMFGLQDLFATFAALTRTEIPKGAALDSQNMLPALRGAAAGRQELLVQQSGASPIFALRDGSWKYISQPGNPGELYDLASDPGEQHNVADLHPARVTALRDRLIALVSEARLKSPATKAATKKRE